MKKSFVLLGLVIAGACGGSVVSSSGSTAGSGGTGGGASSSASSTTSDHSSATAVTTSSVTTTVASSSSSGTGGGIPSCGDFGFNGVGAQCPMEGQQCVVPNACCNGTATCTKGIWVADAEPCAQPCEDCFQNLGCQVGTLCVEDNFNGMTSYQCYQNPCPGMPADCACAGKQVCGFNFEQCVQVQGNVVTCKCC